MNIEVLKSKDLLNYKKLIDECFGGSNDIKYYEKYNKKESYVIFVAKINDEIVGSITAYKIDLFTFSFQPVIELFNVCVSERYRKQNIGKELLNYVIKYAKDNGYRQICLTCLNNALPAHKLYESVGMVKADSIKYKLDL